MIRFDFIFFIIVTWVGKCWKPPTIVYVSLRMERSIYRSCVTSSAPVARRTWWQIFGPKMMVFSTWKTERLRTTRNWRSQKGENNMKKLKKHLSANAEVCGSIFVFRGGGVARWMKQIQTWVVSCVVFTGQWVWQAMRLEFFVVSHLLRMAFGNYWIEITVNTWTMTFLWTGSWTVGWIRMWIELCCTIFVGLCWCVWMWWTPWIRSHLSQPRRGNMTGPNL